MALSLKYKKGTIEEKEKEEEKKEVKLHNYICPRRGGRDNFLWPK
jgi:hypothetical protein